MLLAMSTTTFNRNIVKQIASAGARGFYSSQHCALGDGGITEFVSQDSSECLLRPFGKPARLMRFANGVQLADFRKADGYLHSLEKSYGSRWAFGFIFVPNRHTEDQYLLATGAFDIFIPANSLQLILRYAGRYEMSVPFNYDSGMSLFCGYPGTCIRTWIEGEMLPDVPTETAVWPKTRAVIGADGRGEQSWNGLLADVVMYDQYEPAINKNLPRIWEEYAKGLYS
ncbi:hypothetical protein [Neorhizobium petrolearium]|uniref:hypothetical protein n=1 Tax=Neorhizobium petrolearium TaxID=515361 RepID=UPI003F7E573D